MVPINRTWVVSYSTSIDTIISSVIIFTIYNVHFWWHWSGPVQGHPGSKSIGPIESSLMVSYVTLLSPILYMSSFEIFDEKVLWPRSKMVHGNSRSKVMLPIDSPWVISYSTSIDPIIVSVTVLKYVTCNFDDLEPAQFRVILGQRSQCLLEAHWCFPIWPP